MDYFEYRKRVFNVTIHIRMWTNLEQINVAIYSVIDRSNLGSVGSVSNLWEGILTTR
jgi:hypothetical protein